MNKIYNEDTLFTDANTHLIYNDIAPDIANSKESHPFLKEIAILEVNDDSEEEMLLELCQLGLLSDKCFRQDNCYA